MRKFQILIGIALSLSAGNVSATHLRAAEIIAKRVSCSTLTVEITIIAYLNSASLVSFGGEGSILKFGDGQTLVIPELTPQVIDPVLNVSRVEFKTLYTYAAQGNYTLSFSEANRNEGIVNIESSITTPLNTETLIHLETGVCNSTPSLFVPPVDRACQGVAFYHNPGAVDPDDDSLSYQLVIPQQSQNESVEGYSFPNDRKFYGAGFDRGNENQNGPPTISIDPVDGTLTWDAPGAIGEYAIAIMITEWRLNLSDSTWQKVGHIVRDMQIIVEECLNQKPDLMVPENYCVVAGSKIQFTVFGLDPDKDNVVIEAFSDVFGLTENPAVITPKNGVIQSTLPPHDTATMQFTWYPTCTHVKEQPYQIIFKITDRPPSGPRLVRFKTVQIKVIAPAPEYESVSVNPFNRQVVLQWKDYNCDNVRTFQVWRRVSEYAYEQGECENGMPYYLRYKLLSELSADASGYIDNNLAIGAQYCYRIVALVGDNRIPGRISLDTCIIPKPAEAPVITNVSVVKTSAETGEILIRWTSPFDIDPVQYPPPYQYKVYRATGLIEGTPYEIVTSNAITDTVFTDSGINSEEFPFHYKIELYVPALTTLPVDTSSVASSAFLTTTSKPSSIILNWDANTPWYNYSQQFPYHLIYRTTDLSDGFTLIDSVDVNENGFVYADKGSFQNEALTANKDYYYKVLTRGTYGNPKIIQPLKNLSQLSASMLLDTIPPCPPVVIMEITDCKVFPCSGNNYFNKINWAVSSGECAADVISFGVYVSDGPDDEFIPLTTTTGNSFTHNNLQTRAKCYRVTALDYAGNESVYSETVCSDNCPYFELPNVFTPGNKDALNDFFMAFTAASKDTTKCARFVIDIDISIYDRWGKEVFSQKSISPENHYILWNGLTNTGREVSSGVYFYSANVRFDMRDPDQQKKQFKGWVHVVH